MIRHLGSSLTDVTYVFDGRPIGLHPHDIERMNDLLLQLVDKGNTVLARGVQARDDRDRRPRHRPRPRRRHGGWHRLLRGHRGGAAGEDTTTGRHLDDRASLKESVRSSSGTLAIRGASTHNLQDVDVDIPLGVLCVVTGVAGSGKSSLIHGSVSGRDGVVVIDQGDPRFATEQPGDVHRTARPDPQGVREGQRREAGTLQLQLEGACPTCNGAGVIYTDLGVMATVESTCEECEGKRFQASVLEYMLGGRNIAEVLAMSVTEAEEFFDDGDARTPAAHKILDRLADVGLGYLSLGQPLTTLSGGERQRLKLATQMAEKVMSTSSTSRPPASTSPTSSSCSACSTGSSVPASRSSSSRTTRRSWRRPTGSSTSAPAPATTAAGSSSRAHPPTSSPAAPPSPASTSRPTSAPDARPHARRHTSQAHADKVHYVKLKPLRCVAGSWASCAPRVGAARTRVRGREWTLRTPDAREADKSGG